jgi:hypothetical protein
MQIFALAVVLSSNPGELVRRLRAQVPELFFPRVVRRVCPLD